MLIHVDAWPSLFARLSQGKSRITSDRVWHVACNRHDRVSYVTKSAAVFLVLMILSPVTAPFASFPLSALLADKAHTHASVTLTPSDDSLSSGVVVGTVAVEEQMKDGDVLAAGRHIAGDAFDCQAGVAPVYHASCVDRPQQLFVILRV
jgi:hypothetical protein